MAGADGFCAGRRRGSRDAIAGGGRSPTWPGLDPDSARIWPGLGSDLARIWPGLFLDSAPTELNWPGFGPGSTPDEARIWSGLGSDLARIWLQLFVGLGLNWTKLARIWPGFDSDLARICLGSWPNLDPSWFGFGPDSAPTGSNCPGLAQTCLDLRWRRL